ncbi:hypothetical protein D3C79_1057330 [compost metagenome]
MLRCSSAASRYLRPSAFMLANTCTSSSPVRLKSAMSPEVTGAKPTSAKPISLNKWFQMVSTSVMPRVSVTRAPTGRLV